MRPAILLAALLGAGGVVLGGAKGVGYEPANPADAPPAWELTQCRSRAASCEAALYVADQQACMNVGVHPVPPSRKGARR